MTRIKHFAATTRPIKTLLATAVAAAILSPAQAAEKAITPEQACQAQALSSIAKQWSNVLRGNFEIILNGSRCLVFLQAPSAAFEGKSAAWLIDGKNGELLSEFYGPKDSDRGVCSYRGGKFPTTECTWNQYLDKVKQM